MAPTDGFVGVILAVGPLGFARCSGKPGPRVAQGCPLRAGAGTRGQAAALERDIAMVAIETVGLVVAAGFALVIIAAVTVIIGVRQEERHWSLARPHPPTGPARLARRVLLAYCRVGAAMPELPVLLGSAAEPSALTGAERETVR
jgi:hypothetical protein